MNRKIKIAFFGSPHRAVIALEVLKHAGLCPSLIVTQPDKFQGRKMIKTATPVKIWAQKHKISVLEPENLNDKNFLEVLKRGCFDLFVVVAYGKILKREILNIPKHGSLNLHPSLLPKLRGSSPIETTILNNQKNLGVTIILMDELVDHGPIISQKQVTPPRWPIEINELSILLMTAGAKLLAETIPLWFSGKIKAREQNHSEATFTKKIEKTDGLIDLNDDAYKNYLKFLAYSHWPRVYFFTQKDDRKLRVIISQASFDNDTFVIKRVIPEGKKEMSFADFQKKYCLPA